MIGLHLAWDGAHWVVDKRQTTVEARGAQQADKSFVAADPEIAALVAAEHEATIRYVKTPVGASEYPHVELFCRRRRHRRRSPWSTRRRPITWRSYVKANLPQYAALPVLSMASAFKSGSAGVSDYTDVRGRQPGAEQRGRPVPVPEYAVRGEGRRRRPEGVAGARRAGASTRSTRPRARRRSWSIRRFPSYNFDTITSSDVSYEIDITQPVGQADRQAGVSRQASRSRRRSSSSPPITTGPAAAAASRGSTAARPCWRRRTPTATC